MKTTDTNTTETRPKKETGSAPASDADLRALAENFRGGEVLRAPESTQTANGLAARARPATAGAGEHPGTVVPAQVSWRGSLLFENSSGKLGLAACAWRETAQAGNAHEGPAMKTQCGGSGRKWSGRDGDNFVGPSPGGFPVNMRPRVPLFVLVCATLLSSHPARAQFLRQGPNLQNLSLRADILAAIRERRA
jgi:hypothetical protein